MATKQILSVAPIVQGQKESTQFQIPPHNSSNTANPAPPKTQGTTSNAKGADQSTEDPVDGYEPHAVERKDTYTSDVEQFVDAEETQ